MRPKQSNPRRVALDVLLLIDSQGAYANLSLGRVIQGSGLSGVDQALLFKLVYGTTTMRMALDYVLGQHLTRPLDTLPDAIRNILRMGAYQIIYLDKIPARAAVDEAVKLAHKYGHRGTAGLVNAVLRKVAVMSEIAWPDRKVDAEMYLATRYSHPAYLVRRYLKRLGEEETEALLMANNSEPDFCVRANRLLTTPFALQARLLELEIGSRQGNFVKESLYLDDAPSFTCEPFLLGHYTVQGEASSLVSRMLDPEPGDTILDLCAAPGGKSTHLAELMDNKGLVMAFDVNPNRLRMVDENALRLQIHIVQTHAIEVAAVHKMVSQADKVLLDAPCSGFGVLRHKPDIRYNRQEADIIALASLQRTMIEQAGDLVRPGGRMVYSVCTTEPDETIDVVSHFLAKSSDFILARDLQLWPHRDGVDGFYIAVLERRGG